jgi:tetratricopeptide (TPR) repeat protein
MTSHSLPLKVRRFIPVLVIAAGLLAYHTSFSGAFLFDDTSSILENPTIRRLWPIWKPLSPPHHGGLTVEGRPLINLSLAINYALGGYNVWGYHALNVAAHILAGLTLLGIVRRTLRQPRLRGRFGAAADELALATALLWTVHPLQTEAVTYVIQRTESIMGLFYLLTIYCFIRAAESSRSALWYGFCVSAFLLGTVSKEVIASAPLMVLLYDRAFLSGSFREAWRRRWPLYVALAGAWVLQGFLLASAQLPTTLANAKRVGLSRWVYLRTQPGVILYYLRLSLWPHSICFDHAWPMANTFMSIVPPTVVMLIILGATAWAVAKNSVWGYVGAWFFLILAPSSSIMPLHSAIYEHRMYLSLAAVVSAVVTGLYALIGRRSFAVFVLMVIGLGCLTWRRNQDYRSEVIFWQDAVTKYPNGPLAHYNFGVALGRVGRLQEAIEQYQQVLRINPHNSEAHNNWGVILAKMGAEQEALEHYEQALRFDPDNAEAHYNLGIALAGAGSTNDAVRQYEQALRINPDYVAAHYNLANYLLKANRIDDAIRHYEDALRFNPDYADAHHNLGNAFLQAGRTQEAIDQYEQALRLDPQIAEAHYNLGVVLERVGRIHDATRHYEQALRLKPEYAEAHYNLANALHGVGKTTEAIEHYVDALRIKPDYAEAHYNLGVTLGERGQTGDAIRQYQEAVRIKPDYAEAHNNLGIALVQAGQTAEAVEHFERALQIKPDLAEAHYNLGFALEQAGRVRDAIEHYHQAARLKPDFAAARNALTRLRGGP